VQWRSAADRSDAGAVNSAPAHRDQLRQLETRGVAHQTPANAPKYRYLNYPNIPGEDLLENDQVIDYREMRGRATCFRHRLSLNASA